MVDVASLPRAAALAREARTISQVLAYFEKQGRITAMTVSGPPIEGGSGMIRTGAPSVTIDTSYLEPPPQMLETLGQLFSQRLDQIHGELQGLGVTDAAAGAASS